MSVKTAMELLGHSGCGPNCCCHEVDQNTRIAMEEVAQRARKEMRSEAVLAAIDAAAEGFHDKSASDCADRIVAAIRALPVGGREG